MNLAILVNSSFNPHLLFFLAFFCMTLGGCILSFVSLVICPFNCFTNEFFLASLQKDFCNTVGCWAGAAYGLLLFQCITHFCFPIKMFVFASCQLLFPLLS